MTTHLFGIRHHGPGCARSLKIALDKLQPDCILIEGPPEADALIPMVAKPGMKPPVAILLYVPSNPQQAVFYPFAEFSPEWQAMLYATTHNVPVQFCDLPQSYQLGVPLLETSSASDEVKTDENQDEAAGAGAHSDGFSHDPLLWMATSAGYSDTDTWWEHLVEQRTDSLDLFAAIQEMMTVVRTEIAPPPNLRESRREAYMRQTIRQAEKQGYQRIAVVCGAYHVPALAEPSKVKTDSELLKGLPKAKVVATWTPWSYGRLASRSGYGAGIASPGWYEHLWNHSENAPVYWFTDVANLFRKNDLGASSAHIIEASRFAEALAVVRDRRRPGLSELLDSVLSVFCHGSDTPLRLITDELLINDRLGEIPEDTLLLPLPADVVTLQKRLKLPPKLDPQKVNLDLREPTHVEKSAMIHRLSLLDIQWGQKTATKGKLGTFHEGWTLTWKPEFAIALIEANIWGGTLDVAATARTIDQAAKATTLPELTDLVDRLLLADLPLAITQVMRRIHELSALTPDLSLMLAAIPSLANVLRYGNVRGTDISSLGVVLDGLVSRSCIALPVGSSGIADDVAEELTTCLTACDQAIRLLKREDYLEMWLPALENTATSDSTHPLVAGRCARMLTEQGHWTPEQAEQQLSLRCSRALSPVAVANWIEGFLKGSAALIIHNDPLWSAINSWLLTLLPEAFLEMLPLLRRTFESFSRPEKEMLADRAAAGRGGKKARTAVVSVNLNHEHAKRVVPVLQKILGIYSPVQAGAN